MDIGKKQPLEMLNRPTRIIFVCRASRTQTGKGDSIPRNSYYIDIGTFAEV